MAPLPPVWLYLHFPLLPLELCYHNANPGPAALSEGHRGRLWLCNGEAEAKGVRPGSSIAAASALCPELRLFGQRRPQRERQQLQALALWAGRFSARVALAPPQGLLLEVATMARYFGSLETLRQQLQQALSELRFSVQTASGHTPAAARLLAQQGGCCSMDREALQQQLLQLPVDALEIPAEQRGQLSGMGIRQLQPLLALPREALAVRFGPALLNYLDRLTGRQADPPHYFEPPHHFRRQLILDHELENSQALLFPLRRLLAELEGFLIARQRLADSLQLSLGQRRGQAAPLELGHSGGEYRQQAWLELWRLRLERLQLQQPVVSLTLRSTGLRPMGAAPADLFQPSGGDSPQRLLSRLQTRLGPAAVRGMARVADHRPEKSWRAIDPRPWADGAAAAAAPLSAPSSAPLSTPLSAPLSAPSSTPPSAPPDRPSWLFRQPRPLSSPSALQIELLRGPERIATGWWDQQPIRRDYYIGRWPDGRIGWLFCDERRRWYQHGWFG